MYSFGVRNAHPCRMCGRMNVYEIGKYCYECRDTQEFQEISDRVFRLSSEIDVHRMSIQSNRFLNGVFDVDGKDPNEMWIQVSYKWKNGIRPLWP